MVRKRVGGRRKSRRERVVPGDKSGWGELKQEACVSNLREGLQIGKRDGKVFNVRIKRGKRQIMEDLTRPFKNRLLRNH